MKNFVFCILSQIGIVNQLYKGVIFPLYEHKTDMIRSHISSFGLRYLICYQAAIFAKEIIAHYSAFVIMVEVIFIYFCDASKTPSPICKLQQPVFTVFIYLR